MTQRVCPKCGARAYGSDDRCMDCGTQLRSRNRDDEVDPITAALRGLKADAGRKATAQAPPLTSIPPDVNLPNDPPALARASADSLEMWAGALAFGYAIVGVLIIVLALRGETQWPQAIGGAGLIVSGFIFRDLLLAASRLLTCVSIETQNSERLRRDAQGLFDYVRAGQSASDDGSV